MRVKLQLFSSIICVLGILLGHACKLWFPQFWTIWYAVVLTVYWLVEMVMSFVLERYEGKIHNSGAEGREFMRTYMIAKFAKVLITLALIGTGISFIGSSDSTETLIFVGSALVFYLLNLAVETAIVTKQKK